jgi:hypothetical protein
MLPLHVGSQEDLHAVNQRTTGFQALPADRLFRASRASRPGHDGTIYVFFVGSFLRFVFAKSLSCFSDMESTISFDAPFRLDFLRSPRLAANAAPAAICCFFDLAGMSFVRHAG